MLPADDVLETRKPLESPHILVILAVSFVSRKMMGWCYR